MAKVAQLHDNIDRTKYYNLGRENIIGRSTEATILFDNKRVSRRHAKICAAPHSDNFWIEDISARGTYVNFRRIQGRHPLQEGDRICIIAFRNVHPNDLARMTPEDLKECSEDRRNDNIEAIVDLMFQYAEIEEEQPEEADEPQGLLAKLKGLFGRK
jgi:pSer/pThr/pTyr-binding forkhead associated (FHA) protein